MYRLGVAQLVARDFWEVEVAGSSPVTQTIFVSQKLQKAALAASQASPVTQTTGITRVLLSVFCFLGFFMVLCYNM